MAKGFINRDTRLFWNVDAHVGPGCPNKVDDWQLVQFGYWCLGNNPKTPFSAADRELFAAIKPGAPYSGLPSDPLSIAIKRHQQLRGGTQDGKVSPMQPNQDYNVIIAALSNNISNYLPSIWPQIDKHAKCPAELRAAIVKCFAPFQG